MTIPDEVPPRWLLAEILVDFSLAIEDRRKQRTRKRWPDESDIYSVAVGRLRAAFNGSGDHEHMWQDDTFAGAESASLAEREAEVKRLREALRCDCGAMGDVDREFQTRPHTKWCPRTRSST